VVHPHWYIRAGNDGRCDATMTPEIDTSMAERVKLWREDYPHFATDPQAGAIDRPLVEALACSTVASRAATVRAQFFCVALNTRVVIDPARPIQPIPATGFPSPSRNVLAVIQGRSVAKIVPRIIVCPIINTIGRPNSDARSAL
jgi:hypothetical protein